jgi:sugar phosphate isomerase/epimerase
LGAPIVRVWAGRKGSADADAAYRDRVVEDSRRIADLAEDAGLLVAYEFHGNTLTDTNESAIELLQQVAHTSVVSYWQPMQTASLPPGEGEAYRLAGLRSILPWLAHVHVFHWAGGRGRRPLAEGKALWRERVQLVRRTGRDHYALIEFVRNDEPEAFLDDAAALKEWTQSIEDTES